ncbi:hypothetical protein KIH41_00270 [Litoribacter ruber]|uniref:hypothetical protein n=1 Tax=Litoribacter ruber TaxID=702568 RepID=UPI001BDAA5C6|nr:hypothetical protein [Litoribacter ruber]MBT0809708.1 hypothetical protein [Litoribacter ruber]
MAKQSNILELTGSIGNISFYKTKEGYRARQKGGVTKKRILTDPHYERTRENNAEFGRATSAAKHIRHALAFSLAKAGDNTFHNRLKSLMVKVVQSDPISDRGERTVQIGDLDILQGLRLNKKRSLDGSLGQYVRIEKESGQLKFTLKNCNPELFQAPSSTTHFRLFAQGLRMNFEPFEFVKSLYETPLLPIENNGIDLSFDLKIEGDLPGKELFAVGLEFFQKLGDTPYPVAKKDFNVGEVV